MGTPTNTTHREYTMMNRRTRHAAMVALIAAATYLHPGASIEPVCVPENSTHQIWDCGLSINGNLNHAVRVRTTGDTPAFPVKAVAKAILHHE